MWKIQVIQLRGLPHREIGQSEALYRKMETDTVNTKCLAHYIAYTWLIANSK